MLHHLTILTRNNLKFYVGVNFVWNGHKLMICKTLPSYNVHEDEVKKLFDERFPNDAKSVAGLNFKLDSDQMEFEKNQIYNELDDQFGEHKLTPQEAHDINHEIHENWLQF